MKIIHQCLNVQGIKLQRLQEMTIHHRPNRCALVRLTGEADKQMMESLIAKSAEILVSITVKVMSGKEKTIFRGYILQLHMEEKAEYCQVKVLLADTTYLLDLQKKRKSFQNLEMNYKEIIQETCSQNSFGVKTEVIMNVTDKKISEFILQMDETDWTFVRRMASHFSVPVLTDCVTENPRLMIGFPKQSSREVDLDRAEYKVYYKDMQRQVWQDNNLLDRDQLLADDFLSLIVESDEYLTVGTAVKYQGKSYRVAAVDGRLHDGMMHMRYYLIKNGILISKQNNPSCAGMILTGQVKEVRQDKVKVHFIKIDAAYDKGTTKWFPYSTTYSSCDGSGWFVMPSEGDYVRIFFPTSLEKEAFCIGTINTAPPVNTRNKTLRAPGGKELLLTDNSVHLITKHQDTFIDMSGSGIRIVTTNPVTVSSDKKVTMKTRKMEIIAKEKIMLNAGNASLQIDKNSININGNDVLVGGD